MIFRKAFQEKHELKTVSCYVCHVKGKDAEGNLLGKEHRNEFGRSIAKLLEGKNVTQRIKDARDLDEDAKQKVYDETTKEFLQAVEKVEKTKSSKGTTWEELIKAGDLDAIEELK